MALVTLIRPHVMVAVKSPISPTCPPLGLAYLASSLRAAGYEVKVVDAVGEATDAFHKTADPRFDIQGLTLAEISAQIDPRSDFICISCMYSYEWPNVRNLIEFLHRDFRQSCFVLGGEHSTALPEFCLKDCEALDVCVIGEGEETLTELIGAASLGSVSGIAYRENGDVRRTPPRQRIRDVDSIPEPAWDLFPLENYLGYGYGRGVNRGRNMPLLTSRGCPFRCTFCSNESMWTPRWISRKPSLVVEEMRKYVKEYQITNFDFYDLTTIVNRKWTMEFCQLLIQADLGVTWQLASGTRSEAIDAEVSVLLSKAGCSNISYAPESGSESVLERIQKKISLINMKKSMRQASSNGIICKANVLLGFPGETHREVWDTMKFCVQAAVTGIHDLSVYPFSPYPGSKLFRDLQASGRISEINNDYFYSLALSTELGVRPPSFSEHISDAALGRYRFFGIFLFYATSYLIRPWRLFANIRNILAGTQETLLESALHNRWVRPWKSAGWFFHS